MEELNGYELSRRFWNWSFENPEKVTPNIPALYFFCIEHCNRLGWKKKFGLPTEMAKEAIGIRSYNTYIDTLNKLIEFGFITLIEKSKNQYSSNIIALSIFNNAHNKALDKASVKHVTKQGESTGESTGESISSINKQETNNNILNIPFEFPKPKKKKISFHESDIFEKGKFKEMFPDWSKEKLNHYYLEAIRYSDEGNKYIKWGAALDAWDRKRLLDGKIKFPCDGKKEPPDPNALPENWKDPKVKLTIAQMKLLTPHQQQWKEQQGIV